MIIRSRWRRAGGLATHLGRTDTNKRVRVRDDLTRGVPGDTNLALRLIAAISRTNTRTVRDLVHVKVSPGRGLSDDEIAQVLDRLEREHGIPASMPRHVTEHSRGERADHFHVVYPIVDPETGAAVRSNGNYLADEIASRLSELALDERIVPGPRQEQVVAELRRRGLEAEAGLVAAHAPVRVGDRVGDETRQQAAARGGDPDQLMTAIFEAWRRAGGRLDGFVREVTALGLTLVRGGRVVLVMDGAAGIHIPLARALRQKAKAAGKPVDVRERDLRPLVEEAPTVPEAREQGLAREEDAAGEAVASELLRMAAEAEADGQRQLAERLRVAREHDRLRRRQDLKRTAAVRKRAIREAYARRDRIRRARVNRAFEAAGFFDRRSLRQSLFIVAGAGVLLGGGGLGLALVAAGVAVAALPTRERARAAAMQARLQRKRDQVDRDRELADAYDEVVAENRANGGLRFSEVPKKHRALAGLYAHLLMRGVDGRLDGHAREVSTAAARVLGALAPAIESTLLGTGGRSGLTLLNWYQPTDWRHQAAARAALARGGEAATAARLHPGQTSENRRSSRER